MKPVDNFPAFPVIGSISDHQFIGMSMRDYIAVAAMQGALAGEPGGHLVPHTLARDSYQMADEMLKARNNYD